MPDRLPFEGSYDDYDGVSVLFDTAAIARRYGSQGEPFVYAVVGTLTRLMAAHEIAAFGTRAGGSLRVVLRPGPPDGLDCGVIHTVGTLQVAGWHAFTYGCDCSAGAVEEAGSARVEVPAGWYRVTVQRIAGDDPEVLERVDITLTSVDAAVAAVLPTPSVVPSGDGYL
jgi:hypothetical protein